MTIAAATAGNPAGGTAVGQSKTPFAFACSYTMSSLTGVSSADDVAGMLLKQGDKSKFLRSRYCILSGQHFKYWEDEAACARGEAPKGIGTLLSAEEAQPGRRGQYANPLSRTHGEEYDGRVFVLRLHRPAPKGEAVWKLVAQSRTERLRWLEAIAARTKVVGSDTLMLDRLHSNGGGGGGASEPSESAGNGRAVDIDDGQSSTSGGIGGGGGGSSFGGSVGSGLGAPAPASAAASETHRRVLDALPHVKGLWADMSSAGIPIPKADPKAIQAARDQYASLLRLAPSCWQLLYERAIFHIEIGELRYAESDLSLALEVGATQANVWRARSRCRCFKLEYEDALRDAVEALKLEPISADGIRCRADAYRGCGDLSLAAADYKKVLELNPSDARAWNNLALVHEQTANLPAAEAAVREAVEIDPHLQVAWDNLVRFRSRTIETSEFEMTTPFPHALTYTSAATAKQTELVEFTFGDGPLGVTIEPPTATSDGGVVVFSVAAQSQADQQGVPAGCTILGLDDEIWPVGLRPLEAANRIKRHKRPMKMVCRVWTDSNAKEAVLAQAAVAKQRREAEEQRQQQQQEQAQAGAPKAAPAAAEEEEAKPRPRVAVPDRSNENYVQGM